MLMVGIFGDVMSWLLLYVIFYFSEFLNLGYYSPLFLKGAIFPFSFAVILLHLDLSFSRNYFEIIQEAEAILEVIKPTPTLVIGYALVWFLLFVIHHLYNNPH